MPFGPVQSVTSADRERLRTCGPLHSAAVAGTNPLDSFVDRGVDVVKRILITGGAGFFGSHLCDKLIAQGHDILCVDNYFTGTKRNIEHLLDHPQFEHHQGQCARGHQHAGV